MRRGCALILTIAFGLVGVLATTSVAGAQGQSVTLNLVSQNNSGISGTATLTDLGGGKMRAEIRVTGAEAGPQPAHIHGGSCTQLDPAPRFPLTPVTNGASVTDVEGTLQQVTAAPHAIHLHKSPEELPIYVACADITPAGQPVPGQPGEQSSSLPRTGEATPSIGLATMLAGFGLAAGGAGYALRRRARG